MITKAEKTKQYIIETASQLFNRNGYAGTSMSAIQEAAGLSKGCIYGNFESKEAIAEAAFDFNVSLLFEGARLLKNKQDISSIEKLYAILKFHQKNMTNPKLVAGCPILNTAVEVDDNYPLLRNKVISALNSWENLLKTIMMNGITLGEIRSEIDPDYYAGIFISMIEGGIMLSKIHRNPTYLINNLKEIRLMIVRDLVND